MPSNQMLHSPLMLMISYPWCYRSDQGLPNTRVEPGECQVLPLWPGQRPTPRHNWFGRYVCPFRRCHTDTYQYQALLQCQGYLSLLDV